jgi:ferredoxin
MHLTQWFRLLMLLSSAGSDARQNGGRVRRKESATNMATPSERLSENVPGPFYVTSECIDCDLCREAAPEIYRPNDDIGYSVVHHQPAASEEEARAVEGMEACPVEAIGREPTSVID